MTTGSDESVYSVLLQERGCFSLISDGQPDVGEGGEVVAEPATHLHFNGLARGNWAAEEKLKTFI